MRAANNDIMPFLRGTAVHVTHCARMQDVLDVAMHPTQATCRQDLGAPLNDYLYSGVGDYRSAPLADDCTLKVLKFTGLTQNSKVNPAV
jgi:hypothetical protein